MTQEDKDLLLKDLSTRLPYNVKGRVSRREHNNRECEFVATIDGKLYDRFAVTQESWYDNVTIKPYLFPLSSMMEEQKNEHDTLVLNINFIESGRKTVVRMLFEFYLKNHIDYNGLIPKGLANDATGLNIY